MFKRIILNQRRLWSVSLMRLDWESLWLWGRFVAGRFHYSGVILSGAILSTLGPFWLRVCFDHGLLCQETVLIRGHFNFSGPFWLATNVLTCMYFSTACEYYYYNCCTALWILFGTTLVSWYQKDKTKTNLDFLEQETVNGSGISWAICKSAPRPRQTTTPTAHYSVFYMLDALPAAQPTVWKHWRHKALKIVNFCLFCYWSITMHCLSLQATFFVLYCLLHLLPARLLLSLHLNLRTNTAA